MATSTSTRNVMRTTVIALGLIFILALGLRVAFNAGPSFDEENGRYLYSGNDPWYHHRTVDHMLETGETLVYDPVINYPFGANNPNPPLFDWTAVIGAKMAEMGGAVDPVGLSLNAAVAIWGALLVFPVYFIGKTLWNRNAGLWAALFIALSAPAIQRGVWGFGDHEATTLFWIVLTFAFLLKALVTLRAGEYISSWRDMGAIWEGKKRAIAANREAIMWSVLGGIAMAGLALTWKGYPYVLAIMAVAFGFQLLVDHARNRDSTPIAFVYLIPTVVALVLATPWYLALGFESTTILPHLYVLIGMVVAALILAPTRDLPSILVFPAVLVAAALGLVLLLLVFPDTGRLIFSGMGYFEQTKLYSTIAEAQRTELGFVAASLGFFTFILAFWPMAKTFRSAYKGNAAMMLMAAWAVVALFMAFAAARFVMNAAPVFAIFAGVGTVWILDRAGFAEAAKQRRSLHGHGNPVSRFFKGLTPKSTGVVALVALFLVLPNLWIGVDAGMSSDYQQEKGLNPDRWGAFGIGFDIKRNGWLELFDHLATLDQDTPFEERPAFLAWWDYGHWATAIGKHPTVADPFQHNHQIAGRFLASESEEAAMLWLTVLLLDDDRREHGGVLGPVTSAILESRGLDPAGYRGDRDDRHEFLLGGVQGEDTYAFYAEITDATGHDIRYLGVDARMYPISAQRTGIFYAPAYLANKNPDDFISIHYSGQNPATGQSLQLRLKQYDFDENGDSFRLSPPLFLDAADNEWTVIGDGAGGGQAFPAGMSPYQHVEGGIPVQAQLQVTDRFEDAMYTRAFGHLLAAIPSGDGMRHWRTIFESTQDLQGQELRNTVLLEYFRGHTVTGQVRDEQGQPLSGVTVTFVDGFRAAHDAVQTAADGSFQVLAPFGDDLHLTIRAGGQDIYREPWTISRAEADGGRTDDVTVTVPHGGIQGHVYRDLDGSGTFNATTDQPLAGATVTGPGGETTVTAEDGSYQFSGVSPGQYTISVDLDGYQDGSRTAVVQAGESARADIALQTRNSEVTLHFRDGGEGVPSVPIQITGPQQRTVTTTADGSVTTTLQPGTYQVSVDYSFTQDGQEFVYQEQRTLEVPLGGEPLTLVIDAS